MKQLGAIMVQVFEVRIFNPSASQRIHFTEALLCIINMGYFHHIPQYQYHTEAMIEDTKICLEELDCHKDTFSRCRASICLKKELEALKVYLWLATQKEQESDTTWYNHSESA
jgi:hypothetical protein